MTYLLYLAAFLALILILRSLPNPTIAVEAEQGSSSDEGFGPGIFDKKASRNHKLYFKYREIRTPSLMRHLKKVMNADLKKEGNKSS